MRQRFHVLELWPLGLRLRVRKEGMLQDPFTHKSADGGGEILQQFGMPGYGESSRTVPGEAAPMTPPHKFGMAADVPGWDGVHNVYPYQKDHLTLVRSSIWYCSAP